MSKKQIRILIITLIIIALIVFIVFLLTREKQEIESSIDIPEIQDDSQVIDKVEKKEEDIIYRKVSLDESNIETVARNFTERYGSWSNHNKKDNFKSAEIYMTVNMKQILNDFIVNTEELSDDYTEYYGISTKVLNIEVLDLIEGESASLNISTQRREIRGDLENIIYKNLRLNLIKKDNDWLVNDAEWE